MGKRAASYCIDDCCRSVLVPKVLWVRSFCYSTRRCSLWHIWNVHSPKQPAFHFARQASFAHVNVDSLTGRLHRPAARDHFSLSRISLTRCLCLQLDPASFWQGLLQSSLSCCEPKPLGLTHSSNLCLPNPTASSLPSSSTLPQRNGHFFIDAACFFN